MRFRSFPFGEHRSMAEVFKTEELEAKWRRRELANGEHKILQSLQSRATLPDSMREPDSAAYMHVSCVIS